MSYCVVLIRKNLQQSQTQPKKKKRTAICKFDNHTKSESKIKYLTEKKTHLSNGGKGLSPLVGFNPHVTPCPKIAKATLWQIPELPWGLILNIIQDHTPWYFQHNTEVLFPFAIKHRHNRKLKNPSPPNQSTEITLLLQKPPGPVLLQFKDLEGSV